MKKLLLLVCLFVLPVLVSVASAEWVSGYTRRDGSWVSGYYRTERNSSVYDNLSYNENRSSFYQPTTSQPMYQPSQPATRSSLYERQHRYNPFSGKYE